MGGEKGHVLLLFSQADGPDLPVLATGLRLGPDRTGNWQAPWKKFRRFFGSIAVEIHEIKMQWGLWDHIELYRVGCKGSCTIYDLANAALPKEYSVSDGTCITVGIGV